MSTLAAPLLPFLPSDSSEVLGHRLSGQGAEDSVPAVPQCWAGLLGKWEKSYRALRGQGRVMQPDPVGGVPAPGEGGVVGTR